MKSELTSPVAYRLPLGETEVAMNPLIGNPLSMRFSGRIVCVHCGRETKKSFNQGYCYPCFRALAECDLCIMRPETCHFHQGTCRDPAWAADHCMQRHLVYIANSSGLKVGITRGSQVPTRWIDQGASQAIPVFRVRNRLHSGLIEAAIRKHVSDRTDWRRMLKGVTPVDDLADRAQAILDAARPDLEQLAGAGESLSWERLDEPVIHIDYPVETYPEKVSSLSFDKTPEVTGTLAGIKGQYLILDRGVINMRKFSGYEISLSA
jgi:hypothetical protein